MESSFLGHDFDLSIGVIELKMEFLGTAFVISENEVITAAHVLRDKNALDTPVQITFLGGPAFKFVAVADEIDLLHDIAVLRLVADEPVDGRVDQPMLPPPLAVGVTTSWVRRKGPISWSAKGYPPKINETGHVLSGTVVSTRGTLPQSNARVLQLHVVQAGLASFGGMSGAPILVDGKAVGIVRGHPKGVPEGTLYASALESFLCSPTLERAFRRMRWEASEDLQRARVLQSKLLRTVQPRVLGSAATKNAVYLPPTLHETGTGRRVEFKDLLSAVSARGAVVLGDAGTGKTTMLIETSRKLLQEPGYFGESVLTTPVFLHAHELCGPLDEYEVLARSLSCDTLEFRRLLTDEHKRWVFLIDGLDKCLASEELKRKLSVFLARLDNLCKLSGQRWIATSLLADGMDILPEEAEILRLVPWTKLQAREFLQRSYAARGDALYLRLAAMPEGILLQTPLLLSAAAHTALVTLGQSTAATPVDVLDEFLHDVLRHAAKYVAEADAPAELQRVMSTVGLFGVACAVAESSMKADSPIPEVADKLAARCNFAFGESRRVTERLLRGPLHQCGLLTTTHDGRVSWTHDLFRDYLCAVAIAERYNEETSADARTALLERGLGPTWQRATAFMLVQLSTKRSMAEELAFLDSSKTRGLRTIIDFVALGGNMCAEDVECLVIGLKDWVYREKHNAGSCEQLFADVFGFSPLEALITLAFLGTARSALAALRTDLYLPGRWQNLIDARLAGSETQ